MTRDIFSAVAASLPSFRSDRNGVTFRSWLRGIARHKIRDHFRRSHQAAAGGTDALRRLREIPAPAPEVELSEGQAEVAEQMGITPNAVRQARSRVMRRLKEEMGELIA